LHLAGVALAASHSLSRSLHAADWQIDHQCSQFLDTDALSLAEARLATVETIARSAVEHKGDAVLRVLGEGFVAQME
jgi:hypothetical protein